MSILSPPYDLVFLPNPAAESPNGGSGNESDTPSPRLMRTNGYECGEAYPFESTELVCSGPLDWSPCRTLPEENGSRCMPVELAVSHCRLLFPKPRIDGRLCVGPFSIPETLVFELGFSVDGYRTEDGVSASEEKSVSALRAC